MHLKVKVPHPVRPVASALALLFCLSAFAPVASAGQTIDIDGTVVSHDVYGNGDNLQDGDLPVSGDADGNKVNIINGATVSGDVFGGYAEDPTATARGNEVLIEGSTVTNVFGGRAFSAAGAATAGDDTADGANKVTISGVLNEFGLPVGGYVSGNVAGSVAEGAVTATAQYGVVEITSGAPFIQGWVSGGQAIGGATDAVARAENNSVTVTGGSGVAMFNAEAFVAGGYATTVDADITVKVMANANTVTIQGNPQPVPMTVGNVYGGHTFTHTNAGSYSDANGDAHATGNTVNIENIMIYGNVVGGFVNNPLGKAHAMGNIVNISSNITDSNLSIATGDVVGGKILTDIGGEATGNTVTIRGISSHGSDGAIGGSLYGGQIVGTPGTDHDVFTGNTLNLYGQGFVVTGNLGNFEFLNFYLPENPNNLSIAQIGSVATVLFVTGTADLTDGGGKSAQIGLYIDGASSTLKAGDKVVLIDASVGTLVGTPANDKTTAKATQGILEYDVSLDVADNRLLATFGAPTVGQAAETTKSFSEGYLSTTAFLAQGSDFLTSQGMQAAQGALAGNPVGLASFSAIGGGSLRHETGSHVDVDGYTLVAGVARGFATGAGNASLSAFFEYGDGDYTSTNSFASGKVKGKGNSGYKGIGLLGRFEFGNSAYLESSLRVGKTDVDYRSDSANLGRYDAKSNYVGAHLGAGKEWKLSEADSLDAYLQLLWTHQGKESATPSMLGGSTRLKFDAIDSKRIKIGVRAKHAFLPGFFGYAGLSWDHETSARARATLKGPGGLNEKIPTPDLKGGTGMVEFGLSGKPMANHPLYLDLGVQAHGGKRDGVTASFRASYLF
jgi:hypothetical protein